MLDLSLLELLHFPVKISCQGGDTASWEIQALLGENKMCHQKTGFLHMRTKMQIICAVQLISIFVFAPQISGQFTVHFLEFP